MIEFVDGNLLEAKTEAQVNTVNTVGVMGCGIALQFKNKYPELFKMYNQICLKGELDVGSMFVYPTGEDFPKYIINFPTKKHWKNDSKIEYIIDGMVCLIDTIKLYNINSIAIPALGCQNGGLNFEDVKPLIITACEVLPKVSFKIYNPLKYSMGKR